MPDNTGFPPVFSGMPAFRKQRISVSTNDVLHKCVKSNMVEVQQAQQQKRSQESDVRLLRAGSKEAFSRLGCNKEAHRRLQRAQLLRGAQAPTEGQNTVIARARLQRARSKDVKSSYRANTQRTPDALLKLFFRVLERGCGAGCCGRLALVAWAVRWRVGVCAVPGLRGCWLCWVSAWRWCCLLCFCVVVFCRAFVPVVAALARCWFPLLAVGLLCGCVAGVSPCVVPLPCLPLLLLGFFSGLVCGVFRAPEFFGFLGFSVLEEFKNSIPV